MAEGWEDIPVRYTAEEWEALPQSAQALHSGKALPTGSEERFGAAPPRSIGFKHKGRAPGWYQKMLVHLGAKPKTVPGGIATDVEGKRVEGFGGELTEVSPTGAFMMNVLERKQSRAPGLGGAMMPTASLMETPPLWDAFDEFLDGKDVRGVSDRVKRLPVLQSALFEQMNILKQEEGRRGMISTREAKEHAFRLALSAAHMTYESGMEQLTTKKSGAEGFWSVRRLLSDKGKMLALTKQVGEYNPPPKYGVEFDKHPLMSVLLPGGMDSHVGRVAGTREPGQGTTTRAHFEFLLKYKEDVYHAMGEGPSGWDTAHVMKEAEAGRLKAPVWKALGYKDNKELKAALQEKGTEVAAKFILEQSQEALSAAGNFTTESNAVQAELMTLQRQVQKGRYEEINQAARQQNDDYEKLTQAMGHDWNGAVDMEKASEAVLRNLGEKQTEENQRRVLEAFFSKKRSKLSLALETQMHLIVKSRLASGTMTAEEAVDIWQRAISGKATLGNRTIRVRDEINKFTLPITGAQLMGYGVLMAYRAAMEHEQLMQMTIRDYDESNPEDWGKQASFGHRLVMAARQASVRSIQKMVQGFGNARAGGKVENAVTWESLPSIFMSYYASDELGYANSLLRHWYETETSSAGGEMDTLRRVGKTQALVPQPQTLPQYEPQRPGAYLEPRPR